MKLTHIGIVGRPHTPELKPNLERLLQLCRSLGVHAELEASLSDAPGAPERAELLSRVQALVVLGGDGSLLANARAAAAAKVPLIGINQGRLGFLTDLSLSDFEHKLPAVLGGAYHRETRPLIETSGAVRALAFNDMVVTRLSGNLIDLHIRFDQKPAFNLRADGLIIATPTGSTAYALSAGGPIIHPGVAALALVPVAPFALTMRPIVLPSSTHITLSLGKGQKAHLNADGQEQFELHDDEEVHLSLSQQEVSLLHPLDHNYTAVLRSKLAWSETAESLRSAA
ncbi:MAG: hypothetical protein RLZZ502_330 [Pseudomonadota bacterium]|jgi:NAD+ kinase